MTRRPQKPVDALYPDPKGRRAADAIVDELPMTTTLQEAVDAWEAEYHRVTGSSPWRKG
jgi:hypothetical protein